MKFNKLISLLLAVLMLVSAFVMVAGAEELVEDGPVFSTQTGNGISLINKNGDSSTAKNEPYAYKTQVIKSAEEKISLMDYRYGNDTYEIYVDAYSGEVAVRNKKTEEIIFTNPYNVASSKATNGFNTEKDKLLSQVIISYTDITQTTVGTKTLYSYSWAAVRNQISVRNIKNGIRVEYSIGREETRSLLPHRIEESDFIAMRDILAANLEKAILEGKVSEKDALNEKHRLEQWTSYYGLPIGFERCVTPEGEVFDYEEYERLISEHELLKKKAEEGDYTFRFHNLQEDKVGEKVAKDLESFIKEYYPEFTYDDLEVIYDKVDYEPVVETYPLFKLALEYTLDGQKGFVVTLPANGIRFDETRYRLDGIDILPYMGAGTNPNTGYTFMPDGSGALFRFEDVALLNQNTKITGTIYGQDQAYHQVSGKYEETIRYPVFGVVEDRVYTKDILDKDGNVTGTEDYTKSHGFVAIVEEGDALMQLSTLHENTFNEYNSVVVTVNPRPKDSYNIADAISVGANTDWTVVSDRRYTGNYKIRYIMLTDEEHCDKKTFENEFDASYVGMANAYRDYLIRNKMITKLDPTKLSEDIPLYIETFGAVETTERFLSIPIDVMTPLTSFGDIKTMYEDLKLNGVSNVNFIMTGYTDGGMTNSTVPYGVKWESAVSKEMDFDELLEYADGKFGLFPDFDFVYANNNTLFDGLTLDKHAAKTIDDRYVNKREYSATKHTYVSYYEIALSPAYFDHFYTKFVKNFKKYATSGISLSTLGSDLNSDFDEDEPYNREDSKKYTIEAFKYISGNLPEAEILTSGGNAYSWKYVDHITDVALDSSKFSDASESIPFLGIVLHGYVQLSGEATNMEGNLDYALLKSLENGAALKFILSYRNTETLKEYETLSKYFSVNYEIWYDEGQGDLVSMYKELNDLMKDLQTKEIIGHEFIDGIRVPDDDELIADAEQNIQYTIAYENALRDAKTDEERKAIYEARRLIIKASKAINVAIEEDLPAEIIALKSIFDGVEGDYAEALKAAEEALIEYKAYQQFHAIYSDLVDTTTYSVETALDACKNYIIDPENKVFKEEYEKWETMIGEEYLSAVIDYLAAGEELEAVKSLIGGFKTTANSKTVTKAIELFEKLEAAPDDVKLTNEYNALEDMIGRNYIELIIALNAYNEKMEALDKMELGKNATEEDVTKALETFTKMDATADKDKGKDAYKKLKTEYDELEKKIGKAYLDAAVECKKAENEYNTKKANVKWYELADAPNEEALVKALELLKAIELEYKTLEESYDALEKKIGKEYLAAAIECKKAKDASDAKKKILDGMILPEGVTADDVTAAVNAYNAHKESPDDEALKEAYVKAEEKVGKDYFAAVIAFNDAEKAYNEKNEALGKLTLGKEAAAEDVDLAIGISEKLEYKAMEDEYRKLESTIGEDYLEREIERKKADDIYKAKKEVLNEMKLPEGTTEDDVNKAIRAYIAYIADPENEELKAALEQATVNVGMDYVVATLEVNEAKAVLDAKKEARDGIKIANGAKDSDVTAAIEAYTNYMLDPEDPKLKLAYQRAEAKVGKNYLEVAIEIKFYEDAYDTAKSVIYGLNTNKVSAKDLEDALKAYEALANGPTDTELLDKYGAAVGKIGSEYMRAAIAEDEAKVVYEAAKKVLEGKKRASDITDEDLINAVKLYEAYIAESDNTYLKEDYAAAEKKIGKAYLAAYIDFYYAEAEYNEAKEYLKSMTLASGATEDDVKNAMSLRSEIMAAYSVLEEEAKKHQDKVGSMYLTAVWLVNSIEESLAEMNAELDEFILAEGINAADVDAVIEAYEALLKDPTNESLVTAYNEAAAKLSQECLDMINEIAMTNLILKMYNKRITGLVPGTQMNDGKIFVDAMEALEPYKQAWIDANAKGDSEAILTAKTLFDEKVEEIYQPLFDMGMRYELTFESNRVGGSRYYRDNEAKEFEAATTTLDSTIAALYEATSNAIADEAELIAFMYNLAKMKEAYELIQSEVAYTEAERASLYSLIEEIEVLFEDVDLKNAFDEIVGFDIYANGLKANEEYMKLFDEVNAAGVQIDLGVLKDYEISGLKAATYLKQTAYTAKSMIVEEEKVVINKEEINTEKYNSDAGMIVHETYEGGTEFLLNFNDYRVVVELDGVAYSLEAYGYMLVKSPKKKA